MWIRHSLGEDWTGDPSIYFRVVLSNDASREDRLREVSHRLRATIRQKVNPGKLGLNSYFNFRSLSEQDEFNDKEWAEA